MTTYKLSLDIGSKGVQDLDGLQQCIAIVKKPTFSQSPSASGLRVSPDSVIWLAIPPFETIVVTWEEHYFLYAANQYPDAGASIQVSSQTDNEVNGGERYIFSGGAFTGPGQGDPGWMEVQNNQNSNFSFGLAQKATIPVVSSDSVMSPLNIILVGNNELAAFQPRETVQIFTYIICSNGTVISFVGSEALSLDLSPLKPAASAYFTPADNTFHQGSRPALSPVFAGKKKR